MGVKAIKTQELVRNFFEEWRSNTNVCKMSSVAQKGKETGDIL